MILSITCTRPHTRTGACSEITVGPASVTVQVHTHVQPPTLEHTGSHTYLPNRLKMAMYHRNRKSCSLSMRLLVQAIRYRLQLVSGCVYVCVCECDSASVLIALTPASVKWNHLLLSVFKSKTERAEWLKWTDGSSRLPAMWACLLLSQKRGKTL